MEDGAVLPDDVLIEILINLPVKSLMRCKCVSKNWRSLIKSIDFINRHFEHGRNERVVLMRRLPPPPQGTDEGQGSGGDDVLSSHDLDSLDLLVSPNLSIPFLDIPGEYDSYDFLGASTGLVCVALTDDEIIGLCNPALREFQLLPPNPFSCPEGYNSFIVGSGFGYDARNNMYKVVQLWHIVHEYEEYDEDDEYDDDEEYDEVGYVRMDLFDSSTYSWRKIDAELPLVVNDPAFSLFHNGVCYWLTESLCILAFHLSFEIFREIEYPDFEDEKRESLVVLDGCLSIVRFGRYMEQTVEIWVMREYGVKWIKEFEIGPYAFNCPLLVLRNEWLLVETSGNQLAALALHANEMKRFHFHGTADSMRAVMFTESLFSVKLFAEIAEHVRMKAEKVEKMLARLKDLEDQLAGIDINRLPLEGQLFLKDTKDQLAGFRAELSTIEQLVNNEASYDRV